jgi:hypothetical protein
MRGEQMQTQSFLRRVLLAGAAAVTFCGMMSAQATQFQTGGFVQPPLSFSVQNPAYSGPAGGFAGIWDPTPGANIPINYWCYELGQFFSPGTTYDYTASILAYADLSRLFTRVGGSGAALASSTTSAAFQLAIWELEYDPGNYDILTGAFKVTGGDATAIALAQTWLTGLSAFSPTFTIILLHSDTNQDFITDFQIPHQDLLPEPSSLPLLGLGLAAMIFGMRRRGTQTNRL